MKEKIELITGAENFYSNRVVLQFAQFLTNDFTLKANQIIGNVIET